MFVYYYTERMNSTTFFNSPTLTRSSLTPGIVQNNDALKNVSNQIHYLALTSPIHEYSKSRFILPNACVEFLHIYNIVSSSQ